MEKTLRVAVIGVGGMGSTHAAHIAANPKARLVAVCDTNPQRAREIAEKHGAKAYVDPRELLTREPLDAVTIATPHYDHPLISMDAFAKGIHVLSEKPIAVTARRAREALAAYRAARVDHPGLRYAIMFQERTQPAFAKLKALLTGGILGRLTRATWIHTKWFRSQYYYDHGDWRASWKGEGGGVLLNQCPHTLDLYQWLVGRPRSVIGRVSLGKYHDIEVEDEATAFFEHEGGLVGHFHTTTAECPGTNRLEIAGELGKLVLEDGKIRHWKNAVSMLDHSKEVQDGFKLPECAESEIPIPPESGSLKLHGKVIDAFFDGITLGAPLIAEAEEGLASISMSNAILLSSFQGRTVSLDDVDGFDDKLQGLIEGSRWKKKVAAGNLDFQASWK
ncbi:MAG: Gfo/Idh/MocA family oxidoreductase [Spirochaetes bacterium]|nr:Gfo/Idh/MocA family oxidoreductase [Spirochaetota bacterium]